MFTGIIQAMGTLTAIERSANTARMSINAGQLTLDDVALGDSIAVSGPCLTVVEFDDEQFTVDVSSETLDRTCLARKRRGDKVNLEKALRLSDRLGGHLVSGHVDGIGTVLSRTKVEDYIQFRIEAPAALARYFAAKGSVAVDGVSLTVNDVSGSCFELMIIPHTLKETTLGELEAGHIVNLEIDLVARYLERLSQFGAATGNSLKEALRDSGFIDN